MGMTFYYIFLYMVVAALFVIANIIAIPFIIVSVKKKKVPSIVLGSIAATFLTLSIALGLFCASHASHPDINDWAFLGRNIKDIEKKYGEFERIEIFDDSTGYAILMTEDIVGYWIHDSSEYACYHMSFNENGRITDVWCEPPVGG